VDDLISYHVQFVLLQEDKKASGNCIEEFMKACQMKDM